MTQSEFLDGSEKLTGSSDHSLGQLMRTADGSNPPMTSYNLRPTQRRAGNATTLASANQETQNQVIATSEGLSSQLLVAMPQPQSIMIAAPPGTPKASSILAVAGMGRQLEVLKTNSRTEP